MSVDMLFHTLITRQQDKKNKTDLLSLVTGMLAPFSLSSTGTMEPPSSIIYTNKLKHWVLYISYIYISIGQI